MQLDMSGREFAHFPLGANAPAEAALDVSFDHGKTWYPVTRIDASTGRVQVAGPTSTDNPAGTIVLAAGQNPATLRLSANPEVVIRPAGSIFVTTL